MRRLGWFRFAGMIMVCLSAHAVEGLPDELATQSDYRQRVAPPAGEEQGAYRVDTTGVYYHLRQRDIPAARRELARLKEEHPGWQPPREMLRLFTAHRPRRGAYSRDLETLSRTTPEAADTIPESLLERVAAEVMTQQDASGAVILGWAYYHRNNPSVARHYFEAAGAWGATEAGAEGLKQSCYQEGIGYVAADNSDAIAASASCSLRYGRTDAFESLGWYALEHNRTGVAEQLFAAQQPVTENAQYGRVLSLRRLGQTLEAERLACGNVDVSQRLLDACADAIGERMAADFESGRFGEVLAGAERLRTLSVGRPGLRTVEAWAALKHGDRKRAAALFEGLLKEDGENDDYAVGLVESLSPGSPELERVGAAYPAVARYLTRKTHQKLLARKQFDRIARITPAAGLADGREAWAVEAGMRMRQRSGTKGLARLTAQTSHVGVSAMIGEYRVTGELHAPYLSSGSPGANADFGGRPTADIRTPLESSRGVSPMVGIRREDVTRNLFAALGTTPTGGAVDAAVVGELGAKWFLDPWIPTLRLFSRVNRESLLAYTGTHDTTSFREWGRVVERGAALQLVYLSTPAMSWTFSGEVSTLTGEGVETNRRTYLRGDLAWDVADNLHLSETDYLRVGPFLSSLSYAKNLSFFTLGHGGYYSPQSDINIGFSAGWQTEEGGRYQLRTKASLAYEDAESDAVSRFPLHPDGSRYAGASDTGISMNVQIEGMWLLRPQLMLGGFAGTVSVNEFDESFAGILLRLPFGRRSGVVSADLPHWHLSD